MANQPVLNYVDSDFDTLLAQLQSRLALKGAWKDMYRSSTGSMLMELFAAVGTLVLFYVERRAEESYIGTARNLSSVINLARLINYTPKRNVSSTGTLRFSLSSPATNMVFIPQWTNVQNNSSINYMVSADGVIMPGQTYVDVQGIQGTIVPITFVSTGSTNQEYNLKDTQIENTNVTVTVSNVVWNKVHSFINSINTSTDYIIRPELDGTITIVFGNNVFGLAPLLGDQIVVQYVKSSGLAGNSYSIGSITTLLSTIYDQYEVAQTVTVSNTTTFLGGDDAETIEDIRYNAPKVFATGDRLVTKDDFVAVIKDYPSVADANAWGENEEANPSYNHYNQVKLSVLLQEWTLPSAAFESELSVYLYLKSLMTVRYSFVTPDILDVIPTLIIKVSQGYALTYIQSLIEAAVANEFTLGTTTRLGLSHRQSTLISAIEAVSGVSYCHLTYKIRKQLLHSYNSSYGFAGSMDAIPLSAGGVEIYIDDTRVAIDNGAGGWTKIDSTHTTTGLVTYATGFVGVNISPAPSGTSTIYCRYQQNQNGDIVTTQNQICRLIKNDYTSIGYTS